MGEQPNTGVQNVRLLSLRFENIREEWAGVIIQRMETIIQELLQASAGRLGGVGNWALTIEFTFDYEVANPTDWLALVREFAQDAVRGWSTHVTDEHVDPIVAVLIAQTDVSRYPDVKLTLGSDGQVRVETLPAPSA